MRDKTILVIDDDEQIRQLVQSLMEQEGARVITASGGESALRQFYRYQPDLVIVDMMMPLMSGWEVCRRIRELSDVPLMMLTAVQGDQETVRALTLGCDDYVTKPFCPSVLVARANVLLRRAHLEHGRQPDCNYRDGYLTVDLDAQCVRVEGEPVREGDWLRVTLLVETSATRHFVAVTDAVPGRMSLVAGLGLVGGSCCPHYANQPLRRPGYHRLMRAGEIGPGYGIDDGAALHLVDGALREVVCSREEANAYRVDVVAGDVVERRLPRTLLDASGARRV